MGHIHKAEKMKVTVKSGQTLADIAIQEFGSLMAVVELAKKNGMDITDVPEAGSEISLPEKTYNRAMQTYCKANEVEPATELDTSGLRLGIFTEEFTKEFQ